MPKFFQRLIGVCVLDVPTYEEIEADRSANGQAMVVVLLSAAAAGVGAGGYVGPVWSILPTVMIVALMSWAAWALLTLQIGARLIPAPETRSDVTELMRTIGFASAPGMIRVFGVIPACATPAFIVTTVWMFLTMVVAVRQALDYSTTSRAVAVCAIGFVLTMLIVAALGTVARAAW